MTLNEFISTHDKPDSIILLEGKRKVLEAEKPKLFTLGKLLCRLMKSARFRSGNAPGSDELFADGVASVDSSRFEVVTPYSGHRKNKNKNYQNWPLDEIDLAEEPGVVYQSRSDKKMGDLVDKYASGVKNRLTMKAAYILRDTVKVTGTQSGIPPATVGIFYDDLENPRSGGTGHTMEVCEKNNVPVLNQQIWFGWL